MNYKKYLLVIATVFSVFLFAHTAFASASLMISSAAVASSGKTVTLTMSGVSGSLSPGSGVTGINVVVSTSGRTAVMDISTITTSGSTVTIPLLGIIDSGETVKVDLATSTSSPSTNLTDTGSNTPSGQTELAVTNNSTVTGSIIPLSNANIWQMGYCTAGGGVTGHNVQRCFGQTSRLDMVVNGTDADAQLYIIGGSVTVTVDGTPHTITPTANATYAMMWVPLFTGLSSGNHTVQVNNTDGGNFGILDIDATIRVAGSGLSAEPSYYTQPTIITSQIASGFIQLDGSPATTSSSGYPNIVFAPPILSGNSVSSGDIVIRFRAAVTDISIWASPLYAGQWNVYEDGVSTPIATLSHGADNAFTLYHIASGLDGTSHLYEIAETSVPSQFDQTYALMLAGGSGLVTSALPVRPTLGTYGDSITVGTGLTSINDDTKGDGWIVSRAVGMGLNRQGFGGQCVSGGAGLCTYSLRDDTADVTTQLSPEPTIILAGGGVNDQAQGVNISTFQTDMQTMISNLATNSVSGTKLLVRGVLPNTTANSGNRSSFEAAQAAAVLAYNTACGGGCTKKAYFFNTDGWINSTTDVNGDGLHPIAAGYAKIANREIPIVNGYENGSSFSVSGPSSGTSGVASTNFTVTLPGGATFTGDQSVTIRDGGNGGTFTPSVGSATTTSAVTVTPTNGATSFTFTYTPASSGTKTISFIDGQNAWVDPTSLTYTVSVGDITPPVLSSGSPSGTLSSGTTGTNLTLTTDESATCKYSTTPSTAYASMSSTFSTTGATSQSTPITGLTNGSSYSYYVRCQDGQLNTNVSDYTISFSIANPTTVSSGGGNGGGGIVGLITTTLGLPPSGATTTTPKTQVTTSLQAQLTSLLAELKALQTEQAALQGSSNLSTANTLPHFTFTHALYIGYVGSDVLMLQKLLNTLGFTVSTTGPGSVGHETNKFGAATWKAVKALQTANGIPATGFVGPLTRGYLNGVGK